MKKLLAFLLLLSACSNEDTVNVNGYIEGEYIYISPSGSGILDEIDVTKGQSVKAGDKLFAVDREIWSANLIQAQNELDKAYANFADLSKGKRKQELEVIIRQKAQASATLKNAEKEYRRAQKLVKTKIVSQSDYDRKLSDYENARARVAELDASLASAMLSAREDELKAARNDIEIARQNLLKTEKQAADNTATAKTGGYVEDVYFRLGEFVPAGTPVVSILPPENVKIRFFVSEETFPDIRPNMPVDVICDGCKSPRKARISFISSQSEFTPPVIYSIESREKLVFMAEAVFEDKTQNLHPGLPVTVRISNHEQLGN